MKAKELADVHFTGPVRLARGHEVFTSVAWTQGGSSDRNHEPATLLPLGDTPPAEPKENVRPKLVRLSRLTGKIGDCELVHRYVDPDTELIPVHQVVSLDDYQTDVVASLRDPKHLEHQALALCASIGALAADPAPPPGEDAGRRAEFLSRLGDVCAQVAGTCFGFSTRLSELSPARPSTDLQIPTLAAAGGKVAAVVLQIAQQRGTLDAQRPDALAALSTCLATCRAIAEREDSDIFAVMSIDVSHRHARPRK